MRFFKEGSSTEAIFSKRNSSKEIDRKSKLSEESDSKLFNAELSSAREKFLGLTLEKVNFKQRVLSEVNLLRA